MGGPSITGSKLHMKLSGCFLRAYLFKVMATTPTSKDISYVHKLLIRNICAHTGVSVRRWYLPGDVLGIRNTLVRWHSLFFFFFKDNDPGVKC